METQNPTSDEAVIQALAVEKANLEIQNIRLRHRLAEVTAELEQLQTAAA